MRTTVLPSGRCTRSLPLIRRHWWAESNGLVFLAISIVFAEELVTRRMRRGAAQKACSKLNSRFVSSIRPPPGSQSPDAKVQLPAAKAVRSSLLVACGEEILDDRVATQ